MDKYIEILESLMKAKKEKKKKEPTVKEKEEYRNAWISLATGSGFTGRAEQFLYEGFSFCGAEPFYAYLVQTENQNTTLTTLFSGKCYGNDRNVTFRLITHLLTLMLNNNAPQNVLAPVIKRLPGTCINKEKKRLGTAEKTIEKYFLSELRPDVTLCPLANIGIKPIFINDFVTLVSSVITGIESAGSSKGVVAENIGKIRKWFADYEVSQSTPSEKEIDQKEPAPAVTVEDTGILHNMDSCQEGCIQPAKVTEEAPTDLTAYLVDLLGKAGKTAATIKAEGVQQKIKIDTLSLALENERERIRQANQQIAEHQDTITGLRQRLSAAESNIIVLRQTVEQRDAAIAEKDAEIAERIKMADVLSRDRSRQADETLQRLASKIRIEYRDFVDALDVPMSCDLGENLRLQLQSIFDILEKGGMKIK